MTRRIPCNQLSRQKTAREPQKAAFSRTSDERCRAAHIDESVVHFAARTAPKYSIFLKMLNLVFSMHVCDDVRRTQIENRVQ